MNNPLFTGRSPIGLDVGRCALRAVQLGKAADKRVVIASASIGRAHPDEPVDQAELMRLSRVLTQQGFVGRKIVLAAPVDGLMSAVLEMPPRESGAPYGLIVSQELARLQGKPTETIETSWWDIPQPTRASSERVMAVGCLNADTDPLLDVMEACRYDVCAIDFGMCALVRACAHQLGPAEGLSAVLDLGWCSARLAIVYQSAVVFDRTLLGSGLGALLERVCGSLGVQPEEAVCLIENFGMRDPGSPDSPGSPEGASADERAETVVPLLRPLITAYLGEIAEELKVSFEYASHQYPDTQTHNVVLAGGGAAVPGVAQYMDSLAQQTVCRADAGALIARGGGPAVLACDPSLMATAVGLAGYYG